MKKWPGQSRLLVRAATLPCWASTVQRAPRFHFLSWDSNILLHGIVTFLFGVWVIFHFEAFMNNATMKIVCRFCMNTVHAFTIPLSINLRTGALQSNVS